MDTTENNDGDYIPIEATESNDSSSDNEKSEAKPKQKKAKKKFSEQQVSRRCVVKHCRSVEGPFFPYPRDPVIRKAWEDATGKCINASNHTTKVCAKHFAPSELLKDLKNELLGLPAKFRLQRGVVPHLFMEPEEEKNKDLPRSDSNSSSNCEQSEDKLKPKMRKHRGKQLICIIKHCQSVEGPFFPFPSDPVIRKEWEEATGKCLTAGDNWNKVCAKHFAPSDLMRDLKNELRGLPTKVRLQRGVVPYLFMEPEKEQDKEAPCLDNGSISGSEQNEDKPKPKRRKHSKLICTIKHCQSEEGPFFPFPRDSVVRREWEDATGKYITASNNWNKVCAKHFAPSDFVRDLKNELLGLPTKVRLQRGVVPHLFMEPRMEPEKEQKEDIHNIDPQELLRRSGRKRLVTIKLRRTSDQVKAPSPDFVVCEADPDALLCSDEEESTEDPIQEEINTNVHDYALPTNIPAIVSRILELKAQLSAVRENRKATQRSIVAAKVDPYHEYAKDPANDPAKDTAKENTSVSAEDIRNRYRAAVGFKHEKRLLLKKPNTEEKVEDLPKEGDPEKLYFFSLNPLPLLGNPELTAENYVNQILDPGSFSPLEATKTQLLERLVQSDPDFWVDENSHLMLLDKPSFNMCSIEKDALKTVVQPLKKLLTEASNTSAVKRPRERFFAERKLKVLEPELKEWKDKYNALRKYRKSEQSKASSIRIARAKRNTRRQKRREWLMDQIKQGKMHRSSLIWVNSNKVLPFEREEKKAKSTKKNADESDESSDESDKELMDAVESIQPREPKDVKGKVKKSSTVAAKVSNET